MNRRIVCFFMLMVGMSLFINPSDLSASEGRTKIQINKHGEIRKVSIGDEWWDVNKEQQLAIDKPGEAIPINFQQAGIVEKDFFRCERVLRSERVFVFDGIVKIVNRVTEKKEIS